MENVYLKQANMNSRNELRAVLFDLDNTLYDRDLAFELWARGFVEEQFVAESEAERAEILQRIIAIDAHGYVTKRVLFTQVRAPVSHHYRGSGSAQ